MKRALLLLSMAVILQGCPEPEGGYLVNRVIVNASSYDVQVAVWDSVLVQNVQLESGESTFFEGYFLFSLGRGWLTDFGWLSFDSLQIVANDSLRVYYTSDYISCEERNPGFTPYPNECSGYINTEIDGVRSSVFTFVDADFIDAVAVMD
jgi:NDP-sugar pyrophosphorylase family protein